MTKIILRLATLALFLSLATIASAKDLAPLLKTLHSVGSGGAGNTAAAKAWRELVQADSKQLPEILTSLNQANPLAANWIRSAIDAIAERSLKTSHKLPLTELEAFLLDTKNSPRARRSAFELLANEDKTARERLVPGMLHDPSAELRRDAVAYVVDQAKASQDKEEATKKYEQAFHASVDEDQVKELFSTLKDRGVEIDLAKHYGFLMNWQIIGPFDNTDEKGYHVAFPPEKKIDLSASYPAKDKKQKAKWVSHSTSDETGVVDINEIIGKANGVTSYGYTEFIAEKGGEVQFRITSRNSIKLWLNGKLIDQHEVYHSGTAFDQYISTGKLKKGRNLLLIKVCQNEQTEDWAQTWQFQLRVCDTVGSAILSVDRPLAKKKG